MARPALPPELRTRPTSIAAPDLDRARWEAAANAAGKSLSAWLRDAANAQLEGGAAA